MIQGARPHEALKGEKPLQIVGTINAMAAVMAKRAGFRKNPDFSIKDVYFVPVQ